MNLKLKIDKYGNLINLDTNTIVVPSNELFTDNFWETDGTTWKVNTTTQVTASTSDTTSVVVPSGEFTQNSRVDFYFRLHLPILDYDKKVNIFEFSTGTSTGYDISFYKPSTYNYYYIYVDGSRQTLPILSTESLDIIGILSMCNIGSNDLAVFITLYTNDNGTLTKVAENSYSGLGGNILYLSMSRDYHTNLSSYMVEGIAFDEDIIINPNNNNPILEIINYLNKPGLAEVWANIKNYVTAQVLGKSNTGHTHTKSEITDFPTIPTKTSDLTNDSGFLTSHQDLSGYVPISGGRVMTGDLLASSTTNSLGFGYGWGNGGTIYTYSPTHSTAEWQGTIRLEPLKTTSNFKTMQLAPSGTWTWSGTACQITSDQRYKQQITEIDDKLLDAWEDVELVQFKYKESVDTKGESARLHTGYVVQQIDSACKSHGIDVSAYGLYCHEEYPEETKEVEVEQADGTKTKEIKIIREANEHYSLRYTEALIVECKYLRRCIARLTARIEELEKGNKKVVK
jgi:hypothetical protein